MSQVEEKSRMAHVSWIIDPIASFQAGKPGEQSRSLIFPGNSSRPLKDKTLWDYGKRAFDILQSSLEGETTKESMDEAFSRFPAQLVDVWNESAELLNSLIKSGHLQIQDEETKELRTELKPLEVDLSSFWVAYTIEPYIGSLDDIFQQQNLAFGTDYFPFSREVVAAYFTLCHVDTTAAGVSLNDADAEAYAWVTTWFDKLDAYAQTQKAIEAHQEHIKGQKSKAMNDKRHARRNAAVNLVTEDWRKRKSDFRSAERAGIHYADWLVDKGHEYEPRTITGWIRKYANENGIKLR